MAKIRRSDWFVEDVARAPVAVQRRDGADSGSRPFAYVSAPERVAEARGR